MAELIDLPAPLDIVLYSGTTFRLTLTYKIGDPPLPVDLTNYTAAMKVKDSEGNTLVSIVSPTNITLGGVAGTIAIVIPPSITGPLTPLVTPGQPRYDLLLTAPDTTVTPLLAGKATIKESITA